MSRCLTEYMLNFCICVGGRGRWGSEILEPVWCIMEFIFSSCKWYFMTITGNVPFGCNMKTWIYMDVIRTGSRCSKFPVLSDKSMGATCSPTLVLFICSLCVLCLTLRWCHQSVWKKQFDLKQQRWNQIIRQNIHCSLPAAAMCTLCVWDSAQLRSIRAALCLRAPRSSHTWYLISW